MEKSGNMVLEGVNWVHYDKIMSYGLLKESIGYTMIKLVKWYWKESIGYIEKIRSNGFEMSQLGTQCKN